MIRHGPNQYEFFCMARRPHQTHPIVFRAGFNGGFVDLSPRSAPRRLAVWSGLLSDAATHELGRAATQLPTVVFWYRRGLGHEEIGRRLTPFGGSWDGERAIRAACQLIARQLNRARPSDMFAGPS